MTDDKQLIEAIRQSAKCRSFNPFARKQWNLTLQHNIFNDDREKAFFLRCEAKMFEGEDWYLKESI